MSRKLLIVEAKERYHADTAEPQPTWIYACVPDTDSSTEKIADNRYS